MYTYKEFLLNESLKLSQKELAVDESYAINEGGAYGHLSHPFEDFGLTMQDLSDMIRTTVNGAFSPDNFVQEKCVSGETIVELEKLGPVKIKDLVKNRYEDNILSQDIKGQTCYLPVMDWVDNGATEEWLEIETEDGQSIRVTPNHRIFANGIDTKAEDLKEGDILVISSHSLKN